MWKRRSALLVTALIGLLATAPLRAGEAQDPELEILRSAIRANKKAFLAVNLELAADEAKAFWPVYDRYQADLTVVNDRLLALIDEYTANFTTFSDDEAMKIVERYLAIEQERADVRRRHLQPVAAALPGRKVARFYQFENKIAALFRYELAATIPIIQE